MAENKTNYSRQSTPRKLVMGSDYFYSSDSDSPIGVSDFTATSPPFSLALGGFSAGWGAAYLPPAECDVADWPVSRDELLGHMKICAEDISCSEPIDDLTPYFPQMKSNAGGELRLSSGQSKLLQTLKSSMRSDSTAPEIVGQSRLMTRTVDSGPGIGCKYCGQCNSGCVYDCIYKADLDISAMTANSLIDYRPGRKVITVEEIADAVKIQFLNETTNKMEVEEADVLFLAAGAVNTTRIVMQSQGMYGHSVSLRRTGGFIQPFISVEGFATSWPDVNTQSTHFLEFKDPRISQHWIHAQISQPNELVLSQMRINHTNIKTTWGRGVGLIARHLVVALLNMHSDHGPKYIVRLCPDKIDGSARFETQQELTSDLSKAEHIAHRRLKKILHRSKMISLGFLRQNSDLAPSNHFGCTFPMRTNPHNPTDTDEFGRPFGWKRVHLVDTSIMTSIPATTIGLLAMGNAHRIASMVMEKYQF
jgi:choline dehydrogenase-like flavoprotein